MVYLTTYRARCQRFRYAYSRFFGICGTIRKRICENAGQQSCAAARNTSQKPRFVPKKREYCHCVRPRISHRYLISHELSEYYDMPYYGLYADKVEGLTVNGFSVVPRDGETRPLHNLP